MDAETLHTFRNLAGKGEPAGRIAVNLTAEEAEAYKEVALHNLRIEQEKIPLSHFVKALNGVNASTRCEGARQEPELDADPFS